MYCKRFFGVLCAAALLLTQGFALPVSAEGNAADESVRENAAAETSIKELFEPYFCMEKTMEITEIMNKNAAAYLLENYSGVTIHDTFMSSMILRRTEPYDGTFRVQIGSLAEQYLQFCEDHQLSADIGTLIAPNVLPDWFFYDENGHFLSKEEMDMRLEQAIQSFFDIVLKKHPKLQIKICELGADYFSAMGDRNRKCWDAIYGENSDEFLVTAYHLARKYAPAETKLYFSCGRCESQDELDICLEKVKLLADAKCIDGINMVVDVPEPSAWTQMQPILKKELEQIHALGLDIRLSEVYTTVRPAYDRKGRTEALTAAMSDFIGYADMISAVVLFDHSGMLDGPSPLSELPLAENFAKIIPEKETVKVKQQNIAGDADENGKLDVSDAVLLARFINEDSAAVMSEQGRANCEMNADSVLNAADVTAILRMIAKL